MRAESFVRTKLSKVADLSCLECCSYTDSLHIWERLTDSKTQQKSLKISFLLKLVQCMLSRSFLTCLSLHRYFSNSSEPCQWSDRDQWLMFHRESETLYVEQSSHSVETTHISFSLSSQRSDHDWQRAWCVSFLISYLM